MMAALKYWLYTDDYSPVEKLVENGLFNDKKPLNYWKFPLRNLTKTNESFRMLNESTMNLVDEYKKDISDINDERNSKISTTEQEYKEKFLKYIENCVMKFRSIKLNNQEQKYDRSSVAKKFISIDYTKGEIQIHIIRNSMPYIKRIININDLKINDLSKLTDLVINSEEVKEFTMNVLREINT